MLESFSYSMAQLREKFLEAGSAGEIPAQDHCIREIAQNGFELEHGEKLAQDLD